MRISIVPTFRFIDYWAVFHVQAPIHKTYSGLSYLDKNTVWVCCLTQTASKSCNFCQQSETLP